MSRKSSTPRGRRPSSRRVAGSSHAQNPLVWLGAGVAAWIVWGLTKPGTASAAAPGLPAPSQGLPAPSQGLPAPGSRLPAGSGSAPNPTPSSSPRFLSSGSSGTDVLAWQTTLVYGGYLPDAPTSRDGKFGPLTEAATKKFQEKAGLKIDGIVGPDTRAAAKRMIPGA